MKPAAYLFAVSAFSVLAVTGTNAQDVRDRQTAACMSDALRLCGDAVPDESRITACMNAKRTELNPGCRAYFTDASTADVSAPKVSGRVVARLKAQPISVR